MINILISAYNGSKTFLWEHFIGRFVHFSAFFTLHGQFLARRVLHG